VEPKPFGKGGAKTLWERWSQNPLGKVEPKPFGKGRAKTLWERWSQNPLGKVEPKPFGKGVLQIFILVLDSSHIIFGSTFSKGG